MYFRNNKYWSSIPFYNSNAGWASAALVHMVLCLRDDERHRDGQSIVLFRKQMEDIRRPLTLEESVTG